MKDFIYAALPWIIIGLSVAIAMVNIGKQKVDNNTDEDDVDSNYMAMGMCLGMCMGTALSSTGIFSMAYGTSFGMLIGMVVGSFIKKK